MPTRCAWVTNDPLYIQYHDHEWGIPVHDSQHLFAMLLLEGAQAGVNWLTILIKREAYYDAFDQIDPYSMAKYGDKKIDQLMQNPLIVRNRLKIQAWINNAQAYIRMCEEENWSDWVWGFVDNKPIINHWKSHTDIPPQSPLSHTLSDALKQNGFKFVGPTICYAFMQAVGMVQDHTTDCFRYQHNTQ